MAILYQRDLDLLSPQVYKRFKMLKWFQQHISIDKALLAPWFHDYGRKS